ncbi:MAG: SMC-Scp complex subunit ScpB [Candidatus Rokubacteria bacterium]|nr:SMC-Scp complex subunit ScpB [Candidatus Rokubacteria bacterium]
MGPEALAIVEAMLFASDAPIEVERIQEVLEVSREEALAVVSALQAQYDAPGRGLAVAEVAGGYRMWTRPELAPWLLKLRRAQAKARLSRAALETLVIIAYRQPLARPEIEQLRGVNAEGVLAHLLERRLIRVVGRKETPGRPLLYGTTREFLLHFGLRDLSELPPFEAPAEGSAAPASASEPTRPSDDGQPEG